MPANGRVDLGEFHLITFDADAVMLRPLTRDLVALLRAPSGGMALPIRRGVTL